MEIMRDGSRRRRRAIAAENGGVFYDTTELADLGVFARANTYQWDAPDNDTSLTFQVVKLGGTVHFYEDNETLSTHRKEFSINLMDWATTAVQNDVISQPVTFASHQGVLFITGKYVTPIYVEIIDDALSITAIPIRVRDFSGIPDEIPLNSKPATLSPSHEYNLLNRGWKTGTSTTDGYVRFFTDTAASGTGRYPAKNMIPWMGYSKKAETGKTTSNSEYNPADWTKSYSSAKLEAQIFGQADAPQGSILINPFDTTYGTIGSGVGAQNATVTVLEMLWADNAPWLYATVTVPSPHGLSVGEMVEVVGGSVNWRYTYTPRFGPDRVVAGGDIALSGTWETRANTTGSTIRFRISVPRDTYDKVNGDDEALMVWTGPTTVGVDPILNTVTGIATNIRPTAIAFFAGRLWYAGQDSAPFSDTVMFSQIILNSVTDYTKYGRCYQAGDPTDEFRSLVVPSDGGTIQVPGLSGVRALIPLQNSILVMASTGIYEITGGRNPFSANNFIVRRLSDVEALSAIGIARTDFGIVYTSPRGLYSIAGDEQSGQLVSKAITDDTLKTYWNAVPDDNQELAQLVYDYSLQKLYLLHAAAGTSRDHYNVAMVFDARNSGWYKLTLPKPDPLSYNMGHRIKCALITKAGDGANYNKKVKFISSVLDFGGVGIAVLDMDHTGYLDADGYQPLPYIITAYDGVGGADVPKDFAHRRQAPVIHVYSRRTETGVDVNGVPVNTSSILVEPRWNFTDNNTAGSGGMAQQAYRRPELFLGNPVDDGQPIVISRLKLRGRGKSLHLKFTGEADKDMHILGYAIQYNIGRHA